MLFFFLLKLLTNKQSLKLLLYFLCVSVCDAIYLKKFNILIKFIGEYFLQIIQQIYKYYVCIQYLRLNRYAYYPYTHMHFIYEIYKIYVIINDKQICSKNIVT